MTAWILAAAIVMAAAGGFLMGRHMARPVSPVFAEGDKRLLPVARHLLLGRLSRGMIHELSQSLSVITMANSNLGYILDGLPIDAAVREQIASRLERIAAHCETASRTITHFRWFGQDGNLDKGVLTIGGALDRSIAATRADFRSSGIIIASHGDALDIPARHHHGTIEIIVTSLLLTMQQALAALPDGGTTGPVRIDVDAVTREQQVVIDLAFDVVVDAAVKPEGIDAVNLWLAARIAAEEGGAVSAYGSLPKWFTVRFDRATL